MNKKQRLSEILKRMRAIEASLNEAQEDQISDCIEAGKLLIHIKEEKLVPHGSFSQWCSENIKIEKSQRSVYMTIARYKQELAEIRSWGAGANMKCGTIAEMHRLVKSWVRRDSPAKQVAQDRDDANEKELITRIHAIWERNTTIGGEADAAEFKLLRAAARRKLSIQRYLRMMGLEVPAHRTFGMASTRSNSMVSAKYHLTSP